MRTSSCHSNSYLVLYGKESLEHKKGIANKLNYLTEIKLSHAHAEME